MLFLICNYNSLFYVINQPFTNYFSYLIILYLYLSSSLMFTTYLLIKKQLKNYGIM